MKTYKVGLIRVLTTGDEEFAAAAWKADRIVFPYVPGGVTMYSGTTGGNS